MGQKIHPQALIGTAPLSLEVCIRDLQHSEAETRKKSRLLLTQELIRRLQIVGAGIDYTIAHDDESLSQHMPLVINQIWSLHARFENDFLQQLPEIRDVWTFTERATDLIRDWIPQRLDELIRISKSAAVRFRCEKWQNYFGIGKELPKTLRRLFELLEFGRLTLPEAAIHLQLSPAECRRRIEKLKRSVGPLLEEARGIGRPPQSHSTSAV